MDITQHPYLVDDVYATGRRSLRLAACLVCDTPFATVSQGFGRSDGICAVCVASAPAVARRRSGPWSGLRARLGSVRVGLRRQPDRWMPVEANAGGRMPGM
jgi:hypothetical protein